MRLVGKDPTSSSLASHAEKSGVLRGGGEVVSDAGFRCPGACGWVVRAMGQSMATAGLPLVEISRPDKSQDFVPDAGVG